MKGDMRADRDVESSRGRGRCRRGSAGSGRCSFRPGALQAALLRWFELDRRDMPWRQVRDPYAIWISEVMLQQTQVATARPYYERFRKRFPDVRALAEAPLGDVLKLWEGLGYYSRARNLHAAAGRVAAEYGGELPKSVAGLMELPGIGRYTAGAIASIAFGLDEPVLDGNVTRVLCRLFRIRANPTRAAVRHRLWTLARQIIPPGKAGLFNQALMDLGATVCAPRSPSCGTCPVRARCEAYRHGEQERLPVKTKAKPLPHYDVVAGVIRRGGRILIDQRKAEGLLGGLWEFPGGKREGTESLEEAMVREVREELGIRIRVVSPLTTVKHTYSHFRITLHAFECRYVSGTPRAIGCAAWRWVRPAELERYAFPKANQRVLAVIR
jgi:A/G-specific adenine glycosylase